MKFIRSIVTRVATLPRASNLSRVALGSVVVAVLVLALKTLAAWLTDSAALFSDAMESIVNVATAFVAWWTVRIAARPADHDHPFGHHKAEYLSAVVVGVLIVLSALLILRDAWFAWRDATTPSQVPAGVLLATVSSIVNALWSRHLANVAKQRRSPALAADARHLMVDVYTSAGVIVSLVVVAATGWIVLDALCAVLVGVHVLREGARVIGESVGGLMDQGLPEREMNAITARIRVAARGALEVHDIRTRLAGPALFVDCHLVVDSDMRVGDAHEICDAIEAAIEAYWADARISIHVEPRHKLKGIGLDIAGSRS